MVDQTAEAAQPLELRVPTTVAAAGLDLEASLVDGSPLPSWLTFHPGTRSFSGTPPHATELGISIKGTSASKQSAETTFLLKVGSGGGKPFVSGRLPDITATAGLLFTASLPRVIIDPDGDLLSFSLSLEGGALPGWLRFDPNVLLLSGVPERQQDLRLRLTAMDNDGHTASTSVKLHVTKGDWADESWLIMINWPVI
eukprot:Skav219311  [mRNA]  locus=scaffold1152:97893:98486:- [translate_table: standard]